MSQQAKPAVLFDAQEVRERVNELGRRITADYTDREIAVVGVLKGTLVFMADLIRAIERPLTCHFLKVDATGSGGRIDIAFSSEADFIGRDVLLLEDVVDTGITLSFIAGHIQEDWKPRSLKIVALIDREDHRKVDCPVDYVCFKLVKDGFVVGYGLDFQEHYRELPYLGIINRT